MLCILSNGGSELMFQHKFLFQHCRTNKCFYSKSLTFVGGRLAMHLWVLACYCMPCQQTHSIMCASSAAAAVVVEGQEKINTSSIHNTFKRLMWIEKLLRSIITSDVRDLYICKIWNFNFYRQPYDTLHTWNCLVRAKRDYTHFFLVRMSFIISRGSKWRLILKISLQL